MKRPLPAVTTLAAGFVLVSLGLVLAWLLVLHILPSTFFLNFISYFSSVAGVYLGVIGTALYVRLNRKK